MKILFINQFFWPDSSATSQLLTDLVRGLAQRGHSVCVVCGAGGYASGDVGDAPDAKVIRVKALPFGRGKLGRVLSYGSFYLLAAVKALTISKVDVVVSMTTPPLISFVGRAVKAFRGARHFIWEMDMYPDVAVDLQYLEPNGLLDRLTGMVADYSRKSADGILALGECMRQRLLKRGVDDSRIYITQNWADSEAIVPVASRSADALRLTLLYSGNLGLAHDTLTVLNAMNALRNDSRFQLIFIGGGARRNEVSSFCAEKKLTSIQLRPYAERSNLSESLALGDIGLVTQRDVCCGSVVPSKLYGLLAAGCPVLYIGPRESTPALILKQFECGWQIDCGDTDAAVLLLLHLADHRNEVLDAGSRSRQALLKHFDLPIGVRRIVRILEDRQPIASEFRSLLEADCKL